MNARMVNINFIFIEKGEERQRNPLERSEDRDLVSF